MKARDVAPAAIFGSFDGTNTAIGAVTGSKHLLLGLALCISVAGMLSMATGEWLSEDNDSGLAEAAVMGVATFIGTFIPCLPAVLWLSPWALAVTGLLGLVVAIGVGLARGGSGRQLAISVATFFAVAVPTALIGVAFGAGA